MYSVSFIKVRLIKCTHPSVRSFQNKNVVTTLVGFQQDIARIIVFLLLSKVGKKLNKRGVGRALLNNFSRVLEYILLDLSNVKLHAQSLDLHMYCVGSAYLGRIKVYLGPCQTSGNSRY